MVSSAQLAVLIDSLAVLYPEPANILMLGGARASCFCDTVCVCVVPERESWSCLPTGLFLVSHCPGCGVNTYLSQSESFCSEMYRVLGKINKFST